MERVQDPDERITDHPPHAELHHVAHPLLREDRELLGPHVEHARAPRRRAREHRAHRARTRHVDRRRTVPADRRLEARVVRRRRPVRALRRGNKRRHEEAVLERDPPLRRGVGNRLDGRLVGPARTARAPAARAAREVVLERRLALVVVNDRALALVERRIPTVDGQHVEPSRAAAQLAERKPVRHGRERGVREALFERDVVTRAQRVPARDRTVYEDDLVRRDALHLVSRVLRDPRDLQLTQRRVREVELERRVLRTHLARRGRVAEQRRPADRTAPARELETEHAVLEHVRLRRHVRIGQRRGRGLRRGRRRHGRDGRGRGGLLLRRLGRRRRRLAVVDVPHEVPHEREADEYADQLFRFVHLLFFSSFRLFSKSFLQRPRGGTGS